MILEILLSIFVTFLLYLFHSQKKPAGFPPGPYSWPIFGNLLQVCKESEPHKAVMKMRKQYGDIIGIDLGCCRTVFINEYKLLKEAHNLPVFNGRCEMHHFANPETGLYYGMGGTSGQVAIDQRRFAFSYVQSALRRGEHLVKNEIAELIEDIRKSSKKSVTTDHLFNISTVNALWTIIAGKRYSLDDQDFMTMIKHVTTMFPKLSGVEKVRSNLKPIRAFMKATIEDHKETYKEGVQRDFVDAYLQKISSTTDKNSSFYGKEGDCLINIYMGGTETISSTLRWLVFLLSHYPEVQKKLINTLKKQTGKGELLSTTDRPSLPYVEAIIHEVLRYSALAPLGFFHATLEDTEFHGHKIPKGTAIVSNQYGILHDPAVWGDPENFRPERFLSGDGTEIIRHGALVPFGVGRRVCPGEAFARDELFLFTTSLFKNFRVEFDPSLPVPPIKYKVGHVILPVDHRIIFHDISGE